MKKALLFLVAVFSSFAGAMAPIVFTSDFGTADDGVAIVKGVILTREPSANVIDLTHQIPAFSVRDAGRFVANTSPHYPPGTVFLTLVDRGGAGPRKPIVMKSKKGQFFVQPDNGIVTLVAERDGIEEVREIAASTWVNSIALAGSHAWRDVYSPIAAALARGEKFSEMGPVITKFARFSVEKEVSDASGVRGDVIALDGPFGNLITNIPSASLLSAGYSLGDKLNVTIGAKAFQVPFVKTFDDVPVNALLLYIDSTDHIALAINQGNFASKYKIKPPLKITIPKMTKKK